jgi:3-oxoacyl-[acyl-carrier protein] reductase
MNEVKAPVVWVSGGSRGIGAAVALAFARIGAAVAVSGRQTQQLKRVVEQIAHEGGVGYSVVCDVRSESSVAKAHAKISDMLGAVDVLVNSAGVTYFTSFESTTSEQFDNVIATNLRGTFLCTQHALPGMLAKRKGHIINIVSVAATTPFPNSSVYAASKAGVLTMSRGLRMEVRKRGIRVVDILPGPVDTDIWPEGARKKYGEKMMKPEDVADAIVSVYCQPEGISTDEITLRPPEGDL